MHEIPFNWLAIAACVVLRVVFGGLWYAPFAFGLTCVSLTGCTPDEMKARLPKALISDIIGGLIMAFILAHAVYYAGATTWAAGLAVGLFNWLGFIAVTHFALVMYEKRPLKLFLINNGYQALTLAAMGAILASWPPQS